MSASRNITTGHFEERGDAVRPKPAHMSDESTDSDCEASTTTDDEQLSDRNSSRTPTTPQVTPNGFPGERGSARKITVKNTFVNIEDDCELERDNRRRVRTAPGRCENVSDSDIDTEDEEEETLERVFRKKATTDPSDVKKVKPENACSPSQVEQPQTLKHEPTERPSKIAPVAKAEQPSKIEQVDLQSKAAEPALKIKNTFVSVDDGGIEFKDRRRVSTAPGRYGTLSDDDSDSECEDQASADNSSLLPKAGQLQHREHPPASLAFEQANLGRVQGSVWSLSRMHAGCWAVQQALEAAASEEEREELALELRGHVWEAAHDLHANYVLQKCIMVMHPRSMQFIINELTYTTGAACVASENKYGCRVIQRLLEYCSPAQVVGVVDDLLLNCVANCCHKYSKYAMQCLLEHGTVPQVHNLMNFLAANASQIARDVNGCSVMGKAMSTGLRADQMRVAGAVSAVPGLLKIMAQQKQSHYVAKIICEVMNQAQAVEAITVRGTKTQVVDFPEPAATSAGVNPTPDKHRRRGKGGGKTAQEEAEARDLLESLRAACLRRSPARIAKALQRVQNAFSTPWASATLTLEAAHACEQAHQMMWTLSLQGRPIA